MQKPSEEATHSTHKIYSSTANYRIKNNNKEDFEAGIVIENLDNLTAVRFLSLKKKSKVSAVPILLSILIGLNLFSFYNESKIINTLEQQGALLKSVFFRVDNLLEEYSTSYDKLATALNEKIAKEVRKLVYKTPAANQHSTISNTRQKNQPKAKNNVSTITSHKSNKQFNSSGQANEQVKQNKKEDAKLSLQINSNQTDKLLRSSLFIEEKNNPNNYPTQLPQKQLRDDEADFTPAQSLYKNRRSD